MATPESRLASRVVIVTLVVLALAVAALFGRSWLTTWRESAHAGADEQPQNSKTDGHTGIALNIEKPSPPTKPESLEGGSRSEARPEQQERDDAEFDPANDGWESEVFNDAAGRQLKKFGKLIAQADVPKPEEFASLVSDEVACEALVPKSLALDFSEQGIEVRRTKRDGLEPSDMLHGYQGIAAAVGQLRDRWPSNAAARLKFKIVEVQVEPAQAATRVLVHAYAANNARAVEQSTVWHVRWLRSDKPPLVASIAVEKFEEVALTNSSTWFEDCTLAALGANASFETQLSHGYQYWKHRVVSPRGYYNQFSYGGAIADVNGDGLDDLYVCQRHGLPNRLFIQNADGTATDRSHEAGVDWLDHTASALFLDLDDDADQDLVVGFPNAVVFMANDGHGRFSFQARVDTDDEDVQSMTAADYDNDGDLDIFVCMNFRHPDRRSDLPPFSYTHANDGAENLLLRNDGTTSDSWKFTNATSETGMDVGKHRRSLSASWEDYDKDGDMDLYVANDFGPNALYRNDNGRFVEVAGDSGVIDFGSGMSAAWGDYDRDGHMDLYVANMFSAAGSRITSQQKFSPDLDIESRNLYARFAKGNTLLKSDGSGAFLEVGAEAGVEMGRWAWASLFCDLNNDGWEDIYVANGYVTGEQTDDL